MPQNRPRLLEIDFLRGTAILAMIIIHTAAYHLNIQWLHILWDRCQFAVVTFIFCSGYLYFSHPIAEGQNMIQYAKKRLTRLILPYYLFLIFVFLFVWISQPKSLTLSYVRDSVLLLGGPDINWLVLLFLQFSILLPLFSFFNRKAPVLLWIYGAISIASSLLFLTYKLPFNYKFIMWLPWSSVLLYSFLFFKYHQKKAFAIGSILGLFVVFLVSWYWLMKSGHSLVHYDNKYPPNIYHLAYGTLWTVVLYYAFQFGTLRFQPFTWLLTYFSTYSYSIYFIHWLVIYILTATLHLQMNWWQFFLGVSVISILTQMIFNKLLYFISTLKRGPTI